MEQEINITLRFNLATGKVGLNEIVYELKELRDPLTRISQVCPKMVAITGHCERQRSNPLVHEIAASLRSSQ